MASTRIRRVGLYPHHDSPRFSVGLPASRLGLNALGVGISIGLALEIPQHQVFAVAADDVVGQQGDLAAAARGVDHERGHGIAGRMPAKALDDLQPLRHRGAEMGGAGDRVALVEIVRPDPHFEHVVHQRLHGRQVVVDAPQQHGLRAQGDARVGQPRTGLVRFRRAFVRMGEVQAHPQGMVLPQHPAQFPGDPLGEHGGHFRADSDEFQVRNRTQVREDPVQLVVAHEERIAAGNQHVADFRVVAKILEGLLQPGLVGDDVALAHDPRTGAIAAIAGAEIQGQQQHPVRIAVDHSGGCAVVILAQRVGRFAPGLRKFAGRGDDRPPQGLLGIVRAKSGSCNRGWWRRAGSPRPGRALPARLRTIRAFFRAARGSGCGCGPAIASRSTACRSRRGKKPCERPAHATTRGKDGTAIAGSGNFSPRRFRKSQRPETLLNRQRTVTRVALAGTTGRLLVDFHPGNGRGANIEIIHSLKLLEGRRSRPPGSWRWPLQARDRISYAGPSESRAVSFTFRQSALLSKNIFILAYRKKVKSNLPRDARFTTKFSSATCHDPARARRTTFADRHSSSRSLPTTRL